MAPMLTRLTAVLLLLLAGACASSGSQDMAESGALRNETTTTRLRLRDFVTFFSNRIERASDLITQETDDPSIKRNAVYFKLRVVPMARRSLDRADDQSAMMDLWLYSAMIGQFSNSDDGGEYFGEGSSIMSEAGNDLVHGASALAQVVMTAEQYALAEKGIEEFTYTHGVESDLHSDEKTQDDWGVVVTESLGKPLSVVTKPLSALNLTSGLSDTAIAVHQVAAEADRARSTIRYLPTDTRWQVQLLLLEIEEILDLASLIDSFRQISDSSASLSETARSLPGEISGELTTLMAEVDAKQANLQKTIQDADALVASTDAAAETLVETGAALTKTFEAFDTMLLTLLGPPADPDAPPPPPPASTAPEEKSKPFDITDYGATAAQVTETATALTALLAEAQRLEESSAAPALIEDTGAMARGIVNQVFLSGGLFVLFTALIMLAYKVLSAKLRRASPG